MGPGWREMEQNSPASKSLLMVGLSWLLGLDPSNK